MQPGKNPGEIILEQQPLTPINPVDPSQNDLAVATSALGTAELAPIVDISPLLLTPDPAVIAARLLLAQRINDAQKQQQNITLGVNEVTTLREAAQSAISNILKAQEIIDDLAIELAITPPQAVEYALRVYQAHPGVRLLHLKRYAAGVVLKNGPYIEGLLQQL